MGPDDLPDAAPFRPAVLIPTFNNGRTVGGVVERALKQIPHILVFNDGSTDGTRDVLSGFGERIWVCVSSRNRGKGSALRDGFRRLLETGFSHAITLDADGQHSPEEIPLFLERAARAPDAIIVGERSMGRSGAPRRSRVGLWFSNTALRQLTGVRLADSQCGFRSYPLGTMARLDLRGKRYDLELEVLIRAAWAGVPILSIPVHVTYSPEGGRVSHFRPVRDFLQIAGQVARILAQGREG